MRQIIKNFLLTWHKYHNRLYSLYKINKIKLKTKSFLTSNERDFYLEMQRVLQDDGIVIYDIGAARGVFSCLVAKLYNVAEIHSFEPIPDTYSQLLSSVKPYPNIYCHNVALGNEKIDKEMYITSNSDSSSLLKMEHLHEAEFTNISISKNIIVNCVQLDDYVREQSLALPHVVKIDVQGYEKNVLQGGEKTIRQASYCVVEMSFYPLYKKSPLFDDIYTQMKELGFRLIGMSKPLKGESENQLQVDGIFINCHL